MAGTYWNENTEYVVLVAVMHSQPLLSVFVSDKVTEFLHSRETVLEQLNRLNREELQGTHQLYEFAAGIIYAYKQTCRLRTDFSVQELCGVIEKGIQGFNKGLRLLSRCL